MIPIISILIFMSVGFVVIFFLIFPKKYFKEIEEYAKEYNLPSYLVASVINIESGFDTMALSSAGAMGLMQLKLSTALDMARNTEIEVDEISIYDKDINIELGAKYLSYLLEMFDGNETNALASYNWGLQNVKNWIAKGNVDDSGTIKDIPVKETADYIKKYKVNRWVYKNLYRLI